MRRGLYDREQVRHGPLNYLYKTKPYIFSESRSRPISQGHNTIFYNENNSHVIQLNLTVSISRIEEKLQDIKKFEISRVKYLRNKGLGL
jgi:hypothetical protein